MLFSRKLRFPLLMPILLGMGGAMALFLALGPGPRPVGQPARQAVVEPIPLGVLPERARDPGPGDRRCRPEQAAGIRCRSASSTQSR
jgi:hypothetical protein